MKIRVNPGPEDNIEDVDDEIIKALTKKTDKKLNQKERYSDPAINEFHELIVSEHQKVLNDIQAELRRLLK